jgi:hypothetical protein
MMEEQDYKRGDVCICDHNIEEHAPNGTCMVPGCPCAGFEPEYDD